MSSRHDKNQGVLTRLTSEGTPRTANYMFGESNFIKADRHGYFVNATLSTRPNPLLHGWFDQTEWQDLGVTPVIQDYPLNNLKPLPIFEDRTTWRDVWLENAIVN